MREIIKTCIDNSQNLIVEGCYIPFGWEDDFTEAYVRQIKYICLILGEEYIKNHFCDILRFENVIEKRLTADFSAEDLCLRNKYNLEQCRSRGYRYILIDKRYAINTDDIV